jgi:hypothetical protein
VSTTGWTQVRIFKNKPFARFARRSNIADSELCGAVREYCGLIAADLGGGVIKQRLARHGSGKSGGFRVLILFKVKHLAIFVHGFAKNEADNIGPNELAALKRLAAEMLSYGIKELERALASGTLMEVRCDGENEAVS